MAGRNRKSFLDGLVCGPSSTRRVSALATAACAAHWLVGCGASLNNLASPPEVAGYQAANLFSPTGYSMTEGANGSYHVTAAGPPVTPTDRLEKIALARAAEYGDEQHLKAFSATPTQTSIKCGKTKTADKGKQIDIKPIDLRVVAIDVTYGTDAMDASARPTKATADTLKAQLASETVPPDVQAAAAQEVAQQCGR